jgi:hypothetical protein
VQIRSSLARSAWLAALQGFFRELLRSGASTQIPSRIFHFTLTGRYDACPAQNAQCGIALTALPAAGGTGQRRSAAAAPNDSVGQRTDAMGADSHSREVIFLSLRSIK